MSKRASRRMSIDARHFVHSLAGKETLAPSPSRTLLSSLTEVLGQTSASTTAEGGAASAGAAGGQHPGGLPRSRSISSDETSKPRLKTLGAKSSAGHRRSNRRGGGASFTSLHTASYVPNCVILRHARQLHEESDNGVDSNFSSSPLRFTLVIIDVSGFTKISGWLQQHKGVEGPELMSGFLSRYFHRILDCVAFFGGDVLKFAGDALICMWPELPASVRQACVCAATVVQLLHNYSLPGDVPHTLSLHAAVHLGAGTEMYLGGVRNRWEHCISGALYRRAGHVLDSAPKGSVLASSAVCSVLAKYDLECPDPGLRLIPFEVPAEENGPTVASSSGPGGGRHAERMFEVKLFRSALKTVQPFKRPKRKDVVLRFQALQRDLPMPFTHPALEAVLRRYCPPNLKDVAASVFAAEMRDVTTIFILLPDYSPGCAPLYQQVIVTFQVLLSQFDGRLRQFLTDDKGTVMIGCFGLPGTKAMGRAVRAVRAAVSFRTKLSALCELQMGISSGLVYCGNIGDASRCEYCMLGDSVNMAARMMGLAKKESAALKKQQMKDQSHHHHHHRRRHQRDGSHSSQQQLEVQHEVDDPQSSRTSSVVTSPSQYLSQEPQAQEPAVVKASLAAAAAAAVEPGSENGFAARSFIFCDEATYNAVRDEFVFDDGRDVLLKGKTAPMKCYAVRDDIGAAKANRSVGLHGLSQEQIQDHNSSAAGGGWGSSGGLYRRELPPIVGRDPQLDRAWSNISSQVRGSPVSTVVAFTGPKGSGKTTVLHRLIEMARLANFTVVKAVPAGTGHIDTVATATATYSATNPENGDAPRQYGHGLNSFMYTTVRSWLRGLLESNDWLCVDVWMRAKPRERGQLLRLLHQQETGVQPIPTTFLNTLYETGILEGCTEVELSNLNVSSSSEVAHEMDALAGGGTEHTSSTAQNGGATTSGVVLLPISNAVTAKVSARSVDVRFDFTPDVAGGAPGLSNLDAAMPTDAVNSVLVTFFKHLFCAIGAGRVILAIDDVEFADAESLAFLGQMLATDDDEVQPTVLLTMGGVTAARTERRASTFALHNSVPMLEAATASAGGAMLSSSDGQGLRSQHEIQNVLRSAMVSLELPLKRLRRKDCFALTRQLVASYARALVSSRNIALPSPVAGTRKRQNGEASRLLEDLSCTPAAAASAIVDDGVAEFVFARSAGSPLYVHELIKFLLGARDQRIELVRNPDNTLSWKLIGSCKTEDSIKRFGTGEAAPEPNLSSAVPSALRDILIARVEDCSYAARTTLKMASVIGKRFSRDELLHLALVTNHISVTDKSAAAARARRSVALVLELDELVAAQILVVDNTAVLASAAPSSSSSLRGGSHRAQFRRHSSRSSHRSRAGSDDHSSRGSPRSRKWLGSAGTTDVHKFYSFIHSSMHEVVYSMLLSGHRRRLHRYFAECLRVRGAELPRIADQFERSDQTVRAMSTYMELSAAASSLGNIERAIEVLERAVLIVDGIIMQNNGRNNSLSSDTSLRQTDSATNTTGATGQWSGADNNPQNTPRTRFAAEPSQVSMIPPKFQQIYLKLLTMMMRYKVFLLNKHADLGASGVAVSLDIAQRSLAPLRQMHLSMVRFMRTFPHLAGENLMACLNASVMMHLVDPHSHVDMLTWRNRLSRLTSEMLTAARRQDEPYHVVMALDWVRMNARISQATAEEEQYAAECEQLYCNELPQPTTAKKLDATYGVDNGLLCILCARTRQLLQGNMPRAAELSHHVSAATHFSTNVMSLMMASINEMIWCAILNTGHGSSSGLQPGDAGSGGAELVAKENLRLRRKLARLGVDLSQQSMPIQFLLPLFSPWIWTAPRNVEDSQMEADANPTNSDLQAGQAQADLREQNAGDGATVVSAADVVSHEANQAAAALPASPSGEHEVGINLQQPVSLDLDLETVSQWCENCEQEAAWQKAFPPRAVVTRTIYDGFLGNAALLFKMGCLTIIRRCNEFLAAAAAAAAAGLSENSTSISVQIVEAKAVYARVCRSVDSVWDITDNNSIQPPLLPIIQSLMLTMRVSLGIARGFNLRIVLSDIQSATAFARLHHLDFARLQLAVTIATDFATYAAEKVSTTSNNTEDLGYCFIGDEELARSCAREIADACQVVLELAPQFVRTLPQFETESLRRGKEWANLAEASTTIKGSEGDDSQASDDAVDRDGGGGDGDGDDDDQYLAGVGLAAEEMDFDEGLLDDDGYDDVTGNQDEHDNTSHSVSGHSSASYSDEEVHSVSCVSDDDSSSNDDFVECTGEAEDRVMAEVRRYISSIDVERFEKLREVAHMEATAGSPPATTLQKEQVDQVQGEQAELEPGMILEVHQEEVEHTEDFPPMTADDDDDDDDDDKQVQVGLETRV